jgi:hypothetical protein
MESDSPELKERAAFSADRVQGRQRNAFDPAVGPRPFARPAIADVVRLSGRVGTNHEEVRRFLQQLVRHTGGDHDTVPGPDAQSDAWLSAQSNKARTAADTENLVSGAVIVVHGVDSIPPGAAPGVAREESLEPLSEVSGFPGKRAGIHEKGQSAVWKSAVVREDRREDTFFCPGELHLEINVAVPELCGKM